MSIAKRMAELEKKMNNRSPKPAKRLQHSLAHAQWFNLGALLPTREQKLWVDGHHHLLIHRPQPGPRSV